VSIAKLSRTPLWTGQGQRTRFALAHLMLGSLVAKYWRTSVVVNSMAISVISDIPSGQSVKARREAEIPPIADFWDLTSF